MLLVAREIGRLWNICVTSSRPDMLLPTISYPALAQIRALPSIDRRCFPNISCQYQTGGELLCSVQWCFKCATKQNGCYPIISQTARCDLNFAATAPPCGDSDNVKNDACSSLIWFRTHYSAHADFVRGVLWSSHQRFVSARVSHAFLSCSEHFRDEIVNVFGGRLLLTSSQLNTYRVHTPLLAIQAGICCSQRTWQT